MKRVKQIIIIGMIALFTSVQTGCIGSFGLTNKVYDFNNDLGDKFVNEIVFFGLLVVQAYTVTFIIDGIVLNSIEFWTGNKIISENYNGENIKFTKSENGINIKNLSTSEELTILNDSETNTVYALHNNEKINLIKYNQSNNTAILYLPNHQTKVINLNEQNLADIRNEISNAINLAMQ